MLQIEIIFLFFKKSLDLNKHSPIHVKFGKHWKCMTSSNNHCNQITRAQNRKRVGGLYIGLFSKCKLTVVLTLSLSVGHCREFKRGSKKQVAGVGQPVSGQPVSALWVTSVGKPVLGQQKSKVAVVCMPKQQNQSKIFQDQILNNKYLKQGRPGHFWTKLQFAQFF